MAGFNARTGLEELEEYAVEHVAADIIVNANESNYNLPRPIEQAVAAKLAGFPFNRYPPMQAETLRGLIAEDLALDADNIRIGNGSSELLQMACYAFGGNGRKIAFPYPSFSMYGVYTKLADSIAAPYPLTLAGYVDACIVQRTGQKNRGTRRYGRAWRRGKTASLYGWRTFCRKRN